MNITARTEGEVIVMDLEGQLDFESTVSFQKTCRNLLGSNKNQRVVLNMKALRFVGSTGINHFIDVLKEFRSGNKHSRLCQASSEFSRMFKAHETSREKFEIFADLSSAIQSLEPQENAAASDKTSLTN